MDLATARTMLLGFGGLDGTTRLPDGTAPGTVDAQLWCINMARRRLCRRRRFSFNYQSANLNAAANATSVPLDPSMVALAHVEYLRAAGDVVHVSAVPSLDVFRYLYPAGIASGDLAEYAVKGRSLLLGPPPAQAVVLNCDYWGLLPDLGAGLDTDDFMDHAYELILFEALADFVPIWTLEDARQAVWSATRDELLQDFLDEQADLAGSDGDASMEVPG